VIQNSKRELFIRIVGYVFSAICKNFIAYNICLDENYSTMYKELPDYNKGNFCLGGF